MILARSGGLQALMEFEEQAVFVVGLEPHRTYTVEVDDEEMFESSTDSGGILVLLDVPRGRQVGVRIK